MFTYTPRMVGELISGKLHLHTSTGWRFFSFLCFQPPWSIGFAGKTSKMIRAGDFLPHQFVRGDPVLVRRFLFPESQKYFI